MGKSMENLWKTWTPWVTVWYFVTWLLKMVIYSSFTYWKSWFSTAMLPGGESFAQHQSTSILDKDPFALPTFGLWWLWMSQAVPEFHEFHGCPSLNLWPSQKGLNGLIVRISFYLILRYHHQILHRLIIITHVIAMFIYCYAGFPCNWYSWHTWGFPRMGAPPVASYHPFIDGCSNVNHPAVHPHDHGNHQIVWVN